MKFETLAQKIVETNQKKMIGKNQCTHTRTQGIKVHETFIAEIFAKLY